jgi:hypothetical protein
LAPCEDKTLSVLDASAAVVARWSAQARFSAPVTAAPRGPLQLVAVPQASGRVDILTWDPQTRVLASEFAASHAAEALATAWSASGTLFAGWKDGHAEAWSGRGDSLWQTEVGFEVRFLLADDSLGVYLLGPGQVVLLDFRGREQGRWVLSGTPRGVLQTLGGDLYSWTETGLWKKGYDASAFTLFDGASLLGVTVDRQDRLVLTEPARMRRLSSEGALLSTAVLTQPAVTAASLDDRGRMLVGTASGLEVWTYDGRRLTVLDSAVPAAELLLTDAGLGVWSDADWNVHVWTGFRRPPYGWPQSGGGQGRAYSARRPASVAVRSANWTDDADFGYFSQLVATGEEAKQREVLERLEAKAAQGTLLETWPFANLILLKIGRSGLTDLLLDRNRVLNNWPGLRLRAFALLATTAGPEDRDELIGLLHREFDPAVAALGTQALVRSGWDGDGRLLRMLAELQGRMPAQAVVADAVIDAARSLWSANGQSTDPVLVPLVSRIYQGPYPRAVKLKAQKFFQDLMEAP